MESGGVCVVNTVNNLPEEKKPELIIYTRKVEPYLKDILKWRSEGCGVKEVCYLLDIHSDTFYKYLQTYPELKEVWNSGTDLLVDKMETALYKEATGYEYEEEAISKHGDIVTVKKFARPSIPASKFALTNLRPKNWKNKVEATEKTTLSGINIQALRELSVKDLKKLLASKENKGEQEDGKD